MGEQLARLRAARGLTQQELAEAAGTNNVQISQWEGGERGISTKHLPGLAKALNVPIDALFAVDEDERGQRAVVYYLRKIADEVERRAISDGGAPKPKGGHPPDPEEDDQGTGTSGPPDGG